MISAGSDDNLSLIENALPLGFDFYHLGSVELSGREQAMPALTELERMQAIGFTLEGEVRAALLVLFERGLDLSTYTELGNIIASQVATRVSERDPESIGVMISPPKELQPTAVSRLLKMPHRLGRTYLHFSSTHTIEVHTVWVGEIL